MEENRYIVKLERFLSSKRWNVEKIEALTPDASTRRYFRIYSSPETKIAMVMGELDKNIIFEEIMEKQIEFKELPFINIGRFLKRNGVNVPQIYEVGDGVIILEDFGSTPLDVLVRYEGFGRAKEYYMDSISELVKMQSLKDDGSCYAFSLVFSKNMFLWEFNHFTEYFMGFKLSEDSIMRAEFERISEVLSQAQYVFTHRDYHSKNLMCLGNGRVGIIDFQDALLAPYVYDLVSLTCDAYIDMPQELERTILERYKELTKDRGILRIGSDFEYLYLMCGVQRTLKAAGRFLYIFKEKGNPKFLEYIIPAVRNAIRCAEKLELKSTERIKEEAERKKYFIENFQKQLKIDSFTNLNE